MASLNASAAACTDEMWVVMSDVFLDQPDVLEKLGRVFSAFEGADVPPALFVLIGEFCSTPFGPASPNLTETRGAQHKCHALLTNGVLRPRLQMRLSGLQTFCRASLPSFSPAGSCSSRVPGIPGQPLRFLGRR